MAVPTITLVSPSEGLTTGRNVISITGANFKLPPVYVGAGIAPVPAPTVRVRFVQGTKSWEALSVIVASASQLYVAPPPADIGAADVVVENLDAAGAIIAGETVTASDAYTFKLKDYSAASRSRLTQVVRGLILDLQRQVLPNVVLTVHTEWDETPEDLHVSAEFQKLPVLALIGPAIVRSDNYGEQENVQEETDAPDEGFDQHYHPKIRTLAFDIVVGSDGTDELLNLIAACERYFNLNPDLRVLVDEGDPSAGIVEYEMALTTDFDTSSGKANNSNVRQAIGKLELRGVPLGDDDLVVGVGKKAVDVLPDGTLTTDVVTIPLGVTPNVAHITYSQHTNADEET